MKNIVITLTLLIAIVALIIVQTRTESDEEFINRPDIVKHADPPYLDSTDRDAYFPDSVDTNYIGCPH